MLPVVNLYPCLEVCQAFLENLLGFCFLIAAEQKDHRETRALRQLFALGLEQLQPGGQLDPGVGRIDHAVVRDPRGGKQTLRTLLSPVLGERRAHDPVDARECRVLEVLRVGERDLRRTHAPDGRVELVEALLHDPGGDLAGESDRSPSLVDHDRPVGVGDRGHDRRVVERSQRPQVDDLRADSPGRQDVGGLEARRERAAERDQAEIGAGPADDRPVVLKAGFMLYDINEIEESTETFEFEGALLLSWHDPGQAFDPDAEGVTERVYKGSYQYTELYDGWRPQAFLANESGSYDRQGIMLRVEPDGTLWYVEEIDAVAESPMDLRFFPFDEQTLQIHFKLLGYGADEVRFEPVEDYSRLLPQRDNPVGNAGWAIGHFAVSAGEDQSAIAGPQAVGQGSTLRIDIAAERRSGYLIRVVVLPLMLIVALSWVIFWMDRESLSNRINISFIALLTVVAFQIMVEQALPAIPDLTLMAGFLAINYLLLAATIVINLRVDQLDRAGRVAEGDALDLRCRWLFPLLYFVVSPVMLFAMMAVL